MIVLSFAMTRDSGQSSSVNWHTNPYTLSDLALDALSILNAYGINEVHFVGHSMGGYIVQIIALECPKRTLSITSISAGPINQTIEPFTEKEKRNSREDLENHAKP